ncbi:MAG: hypothetical protein HYZ53_29810 [Planctomycetes bacterium]|nr:hypothetical protein [Planctomycetota bacterium]
MSKTAVLRTSPLFALAILTTIFVAPALGGPPAAPAAPAATSGLDFDVEVPAGTHGPVCIAFDQPLGGRPAWSADAVRLAADSRGHWTARVPFPPGTTIRWKVTRGDWSNVEKSARGTEIDNRVAVTDRGFTRAAAVVARWADGGDAPALPAADADRFVDLGLLRPARLPSPRRVLVRLPPRYRDATEAGRRYPVLYALDGQNLFDPGRSFLGIAWELDRAADAHVAAGGAPFLIVAVDNTPERADEYLPSRDPEVGAGGRLDDFADFLFGELKPKIDAQFRLWWNGEEARALVRGTRARPPLRIWLDMGGHEGSGAEAWAGNLDRARAFRDALVGAGFRLDRELRYLEVPDGGHNEAAWAARLALWAALRGPEARAPRHRSIHGNVK